MLSQRRNLSRSSLFHNFEIVWLDRGLNPRELLTFNHRIHHSYLIKMTESGKMKVRRKGFTLVELLVVIAIIGTLVGMLLPAVQSVRDAARRVTCQNNFRQIGIAIATYESTEQSYPAGRIGCDDIGHQMSVSQCMGDLSIEERNGASGFVSILPQLEQSNLSQAIAIDDGGLWNRDVDDLDWWSGNSMKRAAVQVHLPVLWCPSETGSMTSDVYQPVIAATTTYAFSNGALGPDNLVHVTKYKNDGAFVYKTPRNHSDILDGHSNTFFVGEVVRPDLHESSNVWSYAIANADCLRTTTNRLNTQPGAGIVVELRNGAFASSHPGGANFVYGDGHVDFIDDEIDINAYRALSTVAGGEVQSPSL